MAAQRLTSLAKQILPGKTAREQILEKHPDDVVITMAVRTPLAKAGRGGMKDTGLDQMCYLLLNEVVKKMTLQGLDPQSVEDICLGNVSSGKAAYQIRASSLAAGFPNTTGASSVNRFCSSGLKAVEDIANAIRSGDIEIGLAIGAESMSEGGDRLAKPFSDDILKSQPKDNPTPIHTLTSLPVDNSPQRRLCFDSAVR